MQIQPIFWPELAKLQFPQRIASRTRWCVVLVPLWPLSDGILHIQRTVVKNLIIILDFFFIWKKCEFLI